MKCTRRINSFEEYKTKNCFVANIFIKVAHGGIPEKLPRRLLEQLFLRLSIKAEFLVKRFKEGDIDDSSVVLGEPQVSQRHPGRTKIYLHSDL